MKSKMSRTDKWRNLPNIVWSILCIGAIIMTLIHTSSADVFPEKRSWFSDVVKSAGCHLGLGGCGGSGPPPNKPPTISCPASQTVWAPQGQTVATVSWGSPRASDPDGATPGVTQVSSPIRNSGASYSEGTYTVTYRATDANSASVQCSFSFTVRVHRCSAGFDTLTNGQPTCSPTPNGGAAVWGTVCSYSCNQGYELHGPTRVTCESSEQWIFAPSQVISGASTCQAVQCGQVPTIPRGEVTCTSSVYQTSCPITCDAGYQVTGSDKITCQYNKQWTSPGLCKDVQAPTLQCVDKIEMFAGPKLAPVNVTWTVPSATDNSGVTPQVTSDILSGSLFAPGVTAVTFTSSDADSNVATCKMAVDIKVKRCPTAPQANHSDVACTYDNAYGSECNTTCHSGYKLNGDRTLTCEEDQTWSGLQPSCPPVHCGPIPTVKNGSIVCNSTTYMSVCTLTCGQGYQIDGSDSITCQADRQWTGPGHCKDIQAPDLQCGPDIHTYAGPNLTPTKITWTMPQSTDNSGVAPNVTSDIKTGSLFPPGLTTVKFMSTDGSHNIARCNITVKVDVIQCPALQLPDHANMSCSHGTNYGSDCDTTCHLGYDLKGDKIQTCQANQTWSGQPPHCERMECGKPLFDTTGLMQYNCPHGHYLGENCYISCSDGNPPGGAREITCTRKASGTTGQVMYWTFTGSSPPYCAVGLCSQLSAPKDGSMTCNHINGTGEMCVPSCNAKTMRPPTMPDMYKCLDRTMMWDPDDYVPDCFGSRRPGLPVIAPDFYYYSNTCDPNSQEIKEDFIKALNASFVCGNGCSISSVHVTCYANNVGRRDASGGNNAAYLVVISPQLVLEISTSQGLSVPGLKQFYSNLTAVINARIQKAVTAGEFIVPSIGTYDKFTPGQMDFTCPSGTILDQRELTCAGCGEGHIYDNTTQSCMPCPIGTYQDQEIGFQCLQCPDKKTTNAVRSKSVKECQYLCPPGTFSKSGFEPCDLCPKGSYQSKLGKTSCDFCPFGMSTVAGASTSSTQCRFFNKEMTNTSQGPWIQHFDINMETLSLVTWLRLNSDWPRMSLTFDLDDLSVPSGSAYLSLGILKIFVVPRAAKEVRPWYHLAVVIDNGKVSLYVDGDLKARIGGPTFSQMWRETVSFVNSADLNSVVLSGLEMTTKVLTMEDILPLSTSCEKHLEENILAVDKLDESMTTPSSCHEGSCEKLPAPEHVSIVCEYVPHQGKFCVPVCDTGFIRPSTMPDVYKCLDRSVNWEPMDYVQDCVAGRHPQTTVMKQNFLYFSDSCTFDSEKLEKDFLKILNTSSDNSTCSDNGCDVAPVINVTCSTGSQPQSAYSRISAPSYVEVSLEFPLGPFIDQGTPSNTAEHYNDIAESITAQIKENSDIAETSYGIVEYRCEPGMVLDEELLRCAGCGEGYMYDNNTDTCIACPIGTYQDKEIAFECLQCPDVKATNAMRAKSVYQCQYFCPPGTSSRSGFEPCDLCPHGSYQSKSGMTSCDLCPYGMSTVAAASISDSACQFFDREMTNTTLGPSMQLFDLTPATFSVVTWIHVTSASPRTTLKFDLDELAVPADTAYLSMGKLKVFVQPDQDLTIKEIRYWYHMAVVYDSGEAVLYVDGSQIAKMDNLSFSQMWKETISFVSSDDLNSVTLSGLQMTSLALTSDEVSDLSSSCDRHVDRIRNILLTDRLDVTLVTPSSCDDTNNCEADSCSGHGTCIDGQSHYTCLCEESWGGDTCEDMVVNATVTLV